MTSITIITITIIAITIITITIMKKVRDESMLSFVLESAKQQLLQVLPLRLLLKI